MRVYKYRKHIRWMRNLFGIVSAGMLIFIAIFTVNEVVKFFPVALVVSLVMLLLAALPCVCWYVFYRMAGISVSINDGNLEYSTRSGTTAIPLETITRLSFPSIKYTGGWIKINSPQKSIRFTVVLEDVGEFVAELKNALDSRGLSDCYDDDAFFQFQKTATCSDQGWDRVYRSLRKFLWPLLGGIVLTAGLVYFAGIEDGRAFIVVAPLVVAYVVQTGAELVLTRRFAKSVDEEKRRFPTPDIEMEDAVYRNGIWIGSALYVVGLTAFGIIII